MMKSWKYYHIYVIIINNKYYVGSSINVNRRISQHKSDLKCNRHSNQYLQNLYNKYLSVSIAIIAEYYNITYQTLLDKEEYFISALKNEKNININFIKNPSKFNPPFKSKKVYQFTKKGVFVKKYISIAQAMRETNITNISNVLSIKYPNEKTAGGYLWSYTPICPSYKDNRLTPIDMYDLHNNYIKTFDTFESVHLYFFNNRDKLSTTKRVLCKLLNGDLESYKGYKFRYKHIKR